MKNESAQEVVAGKKEKLTRLKTPSQRHKEQLSRK